MFYNINRWYSIGSGRYGQPDPISSMIAKGLDELLPSVYAYGWADPIINTDPDGLLAIPWSDLSSKCQKKWKEKVLPRLSEVARQGCCRNHFQNEFNVDITQLVSADGPELRLKAGMGGVHGCPDDSPDNKDPEVIKIGKKSVCASASEIVHIIIHELGHYADCKSGNRYKLNDERDGCGSEAACLGFSIGENCKKARYPTR
jgi:RHS repeat-associated protein